MKVLWIVNMVMPDLAEHLHRPTVWSGTWLIDLSHMLAEQPDIELAIAAVDGDSFRRETVGNITYYLLPGNGKNMLFYTETYESVWQRICAEFAPDIVHLHGTEYSHGLSFLRACPQVRAVVSIQGLLNRVKDVDFGGVPLRHLIFGRPLKQLFRFNGEIELHMIHKKNARYEAEILRRVRYINAVNDWDTSVCLSINPDLKVYRLEYNLREEMYASPKWDVRTAERHTIFTNPGETPLKGLHQLIRAVALLKPRYPDIRVTVPGRGVNGRLAVNSAYDRYLDKLIRTCGLQDHIRFVGRQNAQEMCDRMLESRVTVIPSAVESTSLILREAMFLGCPVIAAFRGGMADFVSDKVDGYLYDYPEYPYLAARIADLFEHDDRCVAFSARAAQKAAVAHDRDANLAGYLRMYEDISSG